MIKEDTVEIKIGIRNIQRYKDLGYTINGNKLEISVNDLARGTKTEITAICDICQSERKLIYSKYIRNKERHGFYSCFDCKNEKRKLTCVEKYGVDSYSKTEEFQKNMSGDRGRFNDEKRKQTMLERYGTEYWNKELGVQEKVKRNDIDIDTIINKSLKKEEEKNEKLKLIKEELLNTDIEEYFDFSYIVKEKTFDDELLLKEYEIYREKVDKITNKNKKKLLKEWDGKDFYTGDDIFNNFELHYNDDSYPSIDHKKCVKQGFIEKIDPEIIASLENLCITTRYNNTKKGTRDIHSFLKEIKRN